MNIEFNIDALIHYLRERGVADPAMKELVEDLRCVLTENKKELANIEAIKLIGFQKAERLEETIVLLKRKVRKLQRDLRMATAISSQRSSTRRQVSASRSRHPS